MALIATIKYILPQAAAAAIWLSALLLTIRHARKHMRDGGW